MNIWVKILPVFFFWILIFPIPSFAHPGRTASDGCHYCRTNCDKWGVPWNERHCHGGGVAVTEEEPVIVEKIIPTRAPPTRRPTLIPTRKPLPRVKPTLIPTPNSTLFPTEIPSQVITQPTVSKSQTRTEIKTTKRQSNITKFFNWLFR